MYRNLLYGGAAILLLAACGGGNQDSDTTFEEMPPARMDTQTPPAMSVNSATASLMNTEGTEVGTATLMEEGGAVRIDIQVSGLEPGEYGFHIHEVGRCDAPTFETAGSHFNPTNSSHGFEHPEGPHGGDLRNLEVGADGTANATFTNDMITLAPGQPNSVFDADGSALVIHTQPDDYVTQPSGDAGDRQACGVIVSA